MRSFGVVPAIAILVSALVAAGCAQSVSPATSPKPSIASSPAPIPPPSPGPSLSPAPSVAADTPQSGGTLRFLARVPAGGFDLHRMLNYIVVYGCPVFNNLVYFNPNKSLLTADNIAGDLAERWEYAKDGRSITFHLQKGVKWHDGKPFTADDVVYSLDKMMDSKRSSLGGNFPAYDGASKVDDYTVTVKLKYPSPSFLVQLANPYGAIEARHLADTDYRKPEESLVGTGPYKLKKYDGVVGAEYVRNPNYFRNGMPYLDGLSIAIIADASAQIDAFVGKRLDMTNPSVGVVEQESLNRIQTQAKDAQTGFITNPYGSLLWCNLGFEPLKDARVRRALAMLIDQEQIIIAGFGSARFGQVGGAIFSPAWGLAQAERARLVGWDRIAEQRVAEAKKLMAEAGYANGFKMKLLTATMAQYQRVFSVLADVYRRNLNVECEIVLKDKAEAEKMRAAGDYGLYLQMPSCPLGDPDEFISWFSTGGVNNFISYSNPQVDKLFQEQSQTIDLAARRQLTQQIERLMLTDMCVLPTGLFSTYAINWHPNVQNFVPGGSAFCSHNRMEQVWLKK